MSALRDDSMNALFDALLSLQTRDECFAFLEDLCTISELQAISQRWHVARLLREGLVYAEVGKQSGASSATISRVNRSLLHGSGGYALVLDRLEREQRPVTPA